MPMGPSTWMTRHDCLPANDLTQSLDLVFVLDQPLSGSHDPIDDLEDTSEATRRTFHLHKACDRQAHLQAVLKHNEELNAERDWLDVQRVVLVDTCINTVVLARVLEIADTVTLPFLEKQDELLTCTTAGNGETKELGSWLDIEEAREPRTLGSRAGRRRCWTIK